MPAPGPPLSPLLSPARNPRARAQRQVVLPLSRAVEIAWKSIRLRLSRSLLVTSGIVLALAFLMSIRTNEALLDGMRAWADAAPATAEFSAMRRDLAAMRGKIADLETSLRATAGPAAAVPAPSPGPRFNAKAAFGQDWAELQKDLGPLPGPAGALEAALSDDPALAEQFGEWVAARRGTKSLAEKLNAPDALRAMMKARGVPAAPADVAAGRLQTRWLLGLALLVAFVGILNAMLMSVTERFREIGTMKCLGALDGFIIKLFLIESLFQGVVGTVLGVLGGLGLALAAAASAYGPFVTRRVPWGEIARAGGFCLLVGVALTVAGAVYPAWQAARMQPIEAMRVET